MRSIFSSAAIAVTFVLIAHIPSTTAQTYTNCNPLQGTCPADSALGTSVNIDFTNGASSAFTASGAPTYGSNGAEFTVAKSGDSPLIQSNWYIMFGHVDFVIQAAPGQGIVSSAILQSDCLDEIDWEWLGGDDTQVQTNYFGKGQTTTYNRGAYNAAPANHDGFHTYSVDWTANAIVWSIDGSVVRVLNYAEAATGQYPQTPMMIKVGAWSGGDPSNPAGTIAWAGGETNYADGPYSMYLKSIHVSDYSTGSQYSYSGTSGSWQSIRSSGGQINGSGQDNPGSTIIAGPGVTSADSTTAPTAFAGSHADSTSVYVTPSIYPWVPSATASIETVTSSIPTSYSGLPSGWTVNSSGKVVPPSSGSVHTAPILAVLATFCFGLLFGLRT